MHNRTQGIGASSASQASAVSASLRDEVIAAVTAGNAKALIQTPGWRPNGTATLEAIVVDSLSSKGDTLLASLITIWSKALSSEDPALRITAQAALAGLANRHMRFHMDDALAVAMGAAA